MEYDIKMTKDGILCHVNGSKVYLDPKRTSKNDLNFVSHAHKDHIPTDKGGDVLATDTTRKIINLRGSKIENHINARDNYSLINSGHILGSAGLLFHDVFYTGDICTRKRAFLDAANIPKCKVLITECTFGMPEFVFPSISDIKKQVNQIISENYARGNPVILMGYQLGKAQTIAQLFGHWSPLFYHDSIIPINDLHRESGVDLKVALGHSRAQEMGLLEKKPWIMISPMLSAKDEFVKHMKSKYNAVTIGFSGWAKSTSFSFGRRCDYSIPLSDHCDFKELIQMVKTTGANKVYTTHGFVDEFAQYIQDDLGIDATPLIVKKT